MDKHIGLFLLRIGLGGVFLWFGTDKFIHPDIWVHYIPSWFPMLIPVSLFVLLMGIVETLIGLLVLAGFYTRIAAALAVLMLIPILISLGYNEIGVRDFGLLMLALGILFLGAGELSLDNKLRGGKI
jgi:uncharacterized membrane protein YphA (DoxX/SURF4 family)